MCGIIGYVGNSEATAVLLDGLKRLEYRGYDSAGIAVSGPDGIDIRRVEGKLVGLEKLLLEKPMQGSTGIGHTRWATHGRPSETNAHPHRSGNIVLVHNGIIENYRELKNFLVADNFEFTSETDTEVIAHLISYFLKQGKSTFDALALARKRLEGSYSLVILNSKEPGVLYVAKRGSPLVIGEGKNEKLVASDIPAVLPYTKDMIFLEDGDVAVIDANRITIYGEDGEEVKRLPQRIPWNPLMAEKGGYKHFMLKEIFEQPKVMQDVLAGRIDKERGTVVLDEISPLFDGDVPKFDRIAIIACGTSFHAAMVGKYLIESLARVPVAVDLASEFRYRQPLIDSKTLVIPISQSGETADTLAAQVMARKQGAKVLAICNVVASSVARAADATIYTHAGPEIGVASTKAFVAQLAAIYLFALNLASRLHKIDEQFLKEHIDELVRVPSLLQQVLDMAPHIKLIAEGICNATHVLFIGRAANFPLALEGALKIKEISYMHAEGFAAGELKHGPIALIDRGVPVVAIVLRDELHEKVLSNIEEVKARGASVISVVTEGDTQLEGCSSHSIEIPAASWYVAPILLAIPMQLLAYYAADYKGTDVDQPRNLAKSVTVE
ncbi:MAG: glutamine--fructose-6-phosphate transaminase (isomerizing) [Pseudomonadota bacterium]